MEQVHFQRNQKADFFMTLRKRVNSYFKENDISKNANSEMVFKTITMLSLYFVPQILILTCNFSVITMWLLCFVIGIGLAGIGMSVMHDANHGAYSKNNSWNKWIGFTLDIVGANTLNWKNQHNVLHHTYTNIHGMDDDLESGEILRFSPYQKRRFYHKFQHIYCFFFYSWLTLAWMSVKDFKQLYQYTNRGLNDNIKSQKGGITREWISMIGLKLIYIGYAFVLPVIILDIPWWYVAIGFFTAHFTAGLILSFTFQLAHVIGLTDHPKPDDTGSVENTWAVHQLYTTSNFAKKSKLLSWYIGGLNYQIEHHIFPNICHVHYKKIAEIVKETTKEFDLPYFEYQTLGSAFWSHLKQLKLLGSTAFVKA